MKIDAFYSDPHFGHEKIIGFCDRPFTSTEEMTQSFIKKYNEVVKDDHFVLWCGDAFFCGKDEAKSILHKLNGRKGLVKGNHDKWTDSCFMSLGFHFVVQELVLTIRGKRVRISHYPYSCPFSSRFKDIMPVENHNEFLIHGHTHAKDKMTGVRAIHVGVDSWGYKPVPMVEIERLIDRFSP